MTKRPLPIYPRRAFGSASSGVALASAIATTFVQLAHAQPVPAQPAPAQSAQLGPTSSAAGAATATPPLIPAPAPAEDAASSCTETWSSDRARPRLVERFPDRGISGYVAALELELEHLVGERVFPAGLEFASDAPERALLKNAEFALPDAKSGVLPTLVRKEQGGTVTTHVSIPVIPLPGEAGRHALTLPPLPIAIARASGAVQTLCTKPLRITVEDPLASTANPEQKPNPPPRPQRELWTLARDAAIATLIALPLAALLLLGIRDLKRRFYRPPPPPPPTPPWQEALLALSALESEGLLERFEFERHLDRTADILRKYLGGRYGFDGLECTTREILRELAERAVDPESEQTVRGILQRTDLVKFARRLPDEGECKDALESVRRIVQETTPRVSLDPRSASKGGGP